MVKFLVADGAAVCHLQPFCEKPAFAALRAAAGEAAGNILEKRRFIHGAYMAESSIKDNEIP
jgi:hypothetical protein